MEKEKEKKKEKEIYRYRLSPWARASLFKVLLGIVFWWKEETFSDCVQLQTRFCQLSQGSQDYYFCFEHLREYQEDQDPLFTTRFPWASKVTLRKTKSGLTQNRKRTYERHLIYRNTMEIKARTFATQQKSNFKMGLGAYWHDLLARLCEGLGNWPLFTAAVPC